MQLKVTEDYKTPDDKLVYGTGIYNTIQYALEYQIAKHGERFRIIFEDGAEVECQALPS